ncbi:MAG TPA: hypothetical protein DCF33_16340 [Saprospirales bacterium]|nr:hypothetical protein [Saprospirales bacterium]
MSSARTLLEQLLAKGKLEAALEASMILCKHYQDQEGNAIVVQQSGQFHNLMDDYHAGTISLDDFRPERARINRAMLEWVHSIPATWTTQALSEGGFSEKAYAKEPPIEKKRSWWIALILLFALGTAIAYWVITNRAQIPSTAAEKADQKPAANDQNLNIPGAVSDKSTTMHRKEETSPLKSKSQPQTLPKTTSTQKQRSTPSSTLPAKSEPAPASKTANTSSTSDQKFRSLAKMAIYDDMELGYMGDKYAFKNVRTKEILCCYAAAKGFSDGKAYVSLDGINFFYINKKGDKVLN